MVGNEAADNDVVVTTINKTNDALIPLFGSYSYNTGCCESGEEEDCRSSCCDVDSVGVVGAVAAVLFANTSP